jgi:hypothetical protein
MGMVLLELDMRFAAIEFVLSMGVIWSDMDASRDSTFLFVLYYGKVGIL